VIGEFRNLHVGQQSRSGKATLDGTRWRRSLDHAFTSAAGELGPHVANHLEAIGDVLKLLGNIFAELAQLAAAIGARVTMKSVADNFARQMLGQWLAPRSGLRLCNWPHPFNSGFTLRLRALQLFQMEFKLFEFDNDLLALDAENSAPQLLDDQLQMLDLLAAGTQLLILLGKCLAMRIELGLQRSKLVLMRSSKRMQFLLMLNEQCLQCLSIKPVKIWQRSGIHAHSMPSMKSECINKRRMSKGESRISIKPRSPVSRSAAAVANQCLRVTSTTAHASDKRFLPWPAAR
jgi:hypothetical protein